MCTLSRLYARCAMANVAQRAHSCRGGHVNTEGAQLDRNDMVEGMGKSTAHLFEGDWHETTLRIGMELSATTRDGRFFAELQTPFFGRERPPIKAPEN